MTGAKLSRAEVDKLIQSKQKAVDDLILEYSSSPYASSRKGGFGDNGMQENEARASSLEGAPPAKRDETEPVWRRAIKIGAYLSSTKAKFVAA